MRVVVADDVMLVRSGLARLLSDAGVEVVGEAADADELLRMVALDQPDVAIVDIRMPPTHTDEGLVAARRIRQRYPNTAVVLLSQYLEPRMPSGCSTPTSPAASATCSEERVSDVAVLVDALRRVTEGVRHRPGRLARLMQRRRPDSPLTLLTPPGAGHPGADGEGRSTPASPPSSVSVNEPSRRPAPSCSASLAWSPPQT